MRHLSPQSLFLWIGPSFLMILLAIGPRKVQAADLSLWETNFNSDDDNGCKSHKSELEKAYNEAGTLVDNAVRDLDIVSKPRPPGDRTTRTLANWDRIARIAEVIFAIKINTGKGPEKQSRFDRAHSVFEKMQDTFHGTAPPTKGDRMIKPAFACGQKGWKWVGPNDEDPGAIGSPKPKLSDKKDPNGAAIFPTGVWYWNKRYKRGQQGSSPEICRENILAVTIAGLNLITFCDDIWKRKDLASGKSSAKVDTTLDSIVSGSISATIVHEFAHYFGSPLPDQQAVGKNGDKIWYGIDNKPTITKPPGDPKPVITYGFKYISNLAKLSLDKDLDLSVETADAYSYFAGTAFADNFDWSTSKAQKIPYTGATPKRSAILFRA